MNIFKKPLLFSSVLLLLLSCLMLTGPLHAAAASPEAKDYCSSYVTAQGACEHGFDAGVAKQKQKQACGSYSDSNLSACISGWGYGAKVDPATKCTKGQCDLIGKYVNPTITLLSVSFGLIATVSIILGAIQYSASEGDPQKSAAAKNRITNTIIAIIAFLMLYAFLQFLVPGGVFNRAT
jgi:Type IV secretion system pilin